MRQPNPRNSLLCATFLVLAGLGCAGQVPNLNPCHQTFGTECGRTLFEEQPIDSLSQTSDEVYRCWIDPGWGMSDVVRVEKTGGTFTLVHKDYTGQTGGPEATELRTDYATTTRLMTPEEWEEITRAADASGFWDARDPKSASRDRSNGCPDYIAEGARKDGSHTVDARCPMPGTPARMCDALFAAAGIHTGW